MGWADHGVGPPGHLTHLKGHIPRPTVTVSRESVFRRSGDAITFLDRNDATLSLFGHADRAEFLASHSAGFSPPLQADGRPSREAAEERMAEAFARGHVLFEWTHRRRDGTAFPAEVMMVGSGHRDRADTRQQLAWEGLPTWSPPPRRPRRRIRLRWRDTP